jgi:lysophospholipase L1-like esterase
MIIVFSTIVNGEDSSITLPLEDGETYHSILPISRETANPYRLAVIGDSVAWGNGLNQEHKYYNLVAEWLRANLGKPVEIIVYAHSGAHISGASGESVKNANLNSVYPSLMYQAKNVPNNVDLILVSGGINDIGIANILDPKTSEDTIKNRSENIQEPMKELLMYLVDNTKPDANIIVTGYYPLITDDSKLGLKDRAAGALIARGSEESVSQELINLAASEDNPSLGSAVTTWQSAKEFGINLENIIENDPLFKANSYTFYSTSSNSLNAAVNDVNNAIGGNRVAFVDPLFQSNNGYRASESYLWEFKPGASIESNDEQFDERSKLTNPLDYENKDNALDHPNVKGASRYFDLIKATLQSKRLNWLQIPADSPSTISSQGSAEAQTFPVILSSIWTVSESGPMGNCPGTWTRRTGTNTFDASWSCEGGVTDIIDITSVDGNKITLHRHGINGDYTGTISPDGKSISGIGSWFRPGQIWLVSIPT